MFLLLLGGSVIKFLQQVLISYMVILLFYSSIHMTNSVSVISTNLDCLVGIHNDGNEKTEYHIDEKRDEGVEIDAGEPPHHRILARGRGKGCKHIISIYERVEALHC